MACIGPISVHGVTQVTATAVTRNTSGTGYLYGCLSLEAHGGPGEPPVDVDLFTTNHGYAHAIAEAIAKVNARWVADQAAARQAAE
jgi:hypothetical protein